MLEHCNFPYCGINKYILFYSIGGGYSLGAGVLSVGYRFLTYNIYHTHFIHALTYTTDTYSHIS